MVKALLIKKESNILERDEDDWFLAEDASADNRTAIIKPLRARSRIATTKFRCPSASVREMRSKKTHP